MNELPPTLDYQTPAPRTKSEVATFFAYAFTTVMICVFVVGFISVSAATRVLGEATSISLAIFWFVLVAGIGIGFLFRSQSPVRGYAIWSGELVTIGIITVPLILN